jgi:cell wall-associated NlpC family hydrolase
MFVHDRAKVRTVALLMAGTVALQLWPSAHAHERKVTLTKEVEIKAPQKTKKRKAGHTDPGAWNISPAPAKKKVDPVKLVIKTAYKQLGKPYRWAAVGPNSFDCSGFTMYVWRKAGVQLPHNSGAQRGATKSVSLDKMKPGDLVFSSGHVGLYIGKGKMIHSPQSGRDVSLDPIHSNAYGAGRPLS